MKDFRRKFRSFCYNALLSACTLPTLILTIDSQAPLALDERLVAVFTGIFSITALNGLRNTMPRLTTAALCTLSIAAIADTAFIHTYSWPVDANTLSVLLETNRAEALDFISSIWPLMAVAIAIPILLTIGAWPQKGSANFNFRPQKKLALYSLIAWGSIIAIDLLMTPERLSSIDFDKLPNQKGGQDLALRAGYPSGLPWVLYDFLREREALSSAIAKEKGNRFNIKSDAAEHHHQFYVLVIGESSRADHWQINGYRRETTPKLAQQADLVSFSRMYSPWPYTRLAVPVMITRKSPQTMGVSASEASIVAAFRQIGFYTAWISLQAPTGYHDSPISVHAHEADEQRFLNPVDYRYNGKHDDAAISELNKLLDSSGSRDVFVVIHLLGSHFRYTDRYPRTFAKFLPDNPPNGQAELLKKNHKEELINGYDNSIALTDFVLSTIIEKLDARPDLETWMLYSSDHGEALFDDCRMLSGHGAMSNATQHVSAVFWASQLYREQHADKVAMIESHRNTLASTAMFFETMSDLADMEIEGNRPNNSLASSPLRVPDEVVRAETPYTCPATSE